MLANFLMPDGFRVPFYLVAGEYLVSGLSQLELSTVSYRDSQRSNLLTH